MRRAPARPVRVCILRKWRPVSHVTFEAPLRTSHFALHTSHCTLHTSHFTLHTSHLTLHSPHFSLLTAFFTLHTSSHCTLHAPHFTLHSSHSTLHLIWAILTLSQLISSHLISSHMSSKLSWIQYYFENLHAPCASQARACVLCAKLLGCCCPRTWPARDPGAMQRQAKTFLTLHTALFTLHTPHFRKTFIVLAKYNHEIYFRSNSLGWLHVRGLSSWWISSKIQFCLVCAVQIYQSHWKCFKYMVCLRSKYANINRDVLSSKYIFLMF